MKRSSKLACLFSLGLLSGLFTMVTVNVTNGIKIDLNGLQNIETSHRARLKQLYLWTTGESIENTNNSAARMSTSPDAKTLDIYKGLIVKDSVSDAGDSGALIVVGGGRDNSIQKGNNSGIAGGLRNKIGDSNASESIDNAAIGGGMDNSILGENGVVAGGSTNKGGEGGVVLGGSSNVATGVVLGGKNNSVDKDGLAMGQGAIGKEGSFVWNDSADKVTAKSNSARIGAQKGVLIGTYTPKDGVSLVVNGPVKLGDADDSVLNVPGEIRSKNGCLYAFDGNGWHVLGNASAGNCNDLQLAKTCKFGRILLQQGDKVEAYSQVYSSNGSCEANKTRVVCADGHLVPVDGGEADKYINPSCYNLDTHPYDLPQN